VKEITVGEPAYDAPGHFNLGAIRLEDYLETPTRK
jgi:hypothetical protein